jgi:hypothetical protein
LFGKLKDVSDSKTRMITELQTLVATTVAELAGARNSTAEALASPSIAHVRELAKTAGRGMAASGTEAAKQHNAGVDHGKLYSVALRGKVRHTTNLQSHPMKVKPQTQSKKYQNQTSVQPKLK